MHPCLHIQTLQIVPVTKVGGLQYAPLIMEDTARVYSRCRNVGMSLKLLRWIEVIRTAQTLFPTDAYHYFHGGRKLKTKNTRPVSLQSIYESAVHKLAGKLTSQPSKRSQDSDDDLDCKPPAKKPRNTKKCAVPPYSTMCALCFNDLGLVLQFRSQWESSKHMLAIRSICM